MTEPSRPNTSSPRDRLVASLLVLVGSMVPVLAPAGCGSGDAAAEGTGGDGPAITGAGGGGVGVPRACMPAAGPLPGQAFDLAGGQWTIENVSNTPGTISNEGVIAFTKEGAATVTFAEPDSQVVSDQDIWATTNAGDGWSPAEALSNDVDVQNAFASMQSDGCEVHLVYSGYAEGLNDVYYARRTATGWTPRTNLTAAFEAREGRHDYAPSLAIGPDGQLALAYLSAAADESGSSSGPEEVRVLRIQDGQAAGPPETAIPSPDGRPCFDPSAAFDATGRLHVVADCVGDGSEDIYYAVDDGEGWNAMTLTVKDERDDQRPVLAIDPKSQMVHVAWMSFEICPSGLCAKLQYTRGLGGSFTTPGPVHPGDAGYEVAPIITIDGAGRPIIGYHQMNAQNFGDVLVTWSDDAGATFSPGRVVTPGTDDSDEWFPSALVLDPTTGLPVLLFQAILPNSDPVDSDVMRATFVGD